MEPMSAPTFVHLHNHSDYSLLDGAMKTKAMAQRAAALGMPALALTDHGNMFGAVEFYLRCREAGVQPIIGMEAYVADDRLDRSSERAKRPSHLVLLARNETGWHNLIHLASRGFLEGYYYKPRIDKELLSRHSEGLIGLSACLSGEPNRLVSRDDLAGATRVAETYAEILGRENYFLEIQNHGLPQEDRVRQLMPKVAKAAGLQIVATNDCHYLQLEHHQAHDILLCIQTNRLYDDPQRWRYQTDQVYFKSPEQMLELFQDWPEAAANTLQIADRCRLELQLGQLLLPEFPIPAPFGTADDYLAHLAREGLQRRYGRTTPDLTDRLSYELDIIKRTGYAGYFLIVWDFILAARRLGIAVGPGRGSAAGSIVCYCLEITDIEPLSNGLIFERFLNPERVSMPDIDIDFCFAKRPQIIQYVVDKYGKQNVSQIITFGTLAARAALKDTARVLGFSFQEADRISKLVPEEIGITLKKALEEIPELGAVRKESPRHDMLIRNAMILEGLCRNAGIHAAGILITPSALVDHIPLYRSTKDDITSQFDMKMIEELGLLKMDFLGLRTLTVIDKTLELMRETKGIEMRADEIPLDDPDTFDLLQQGRTVGIFQLESGGMQELVRKLEPTCFEDITAVNALFRPGPLGAKMDQVYVDRKHGRRPVTYVHPALEPILKETYGVVLYQEQVMRIAGELAGFSMGQADLLRKAMGKKKKKMMAQMRGLFLDGAKRKGIPREKAVAIFDEMAFFAEYGFNKSHSASYAVLSLRTAWLKRHHAAEFMAATMTTEMRRAERITVLIDEVKNLGLSIAPPDINQPRSEFAVRGAEIVFGMGAVKNVGTKAIAEIEAATQRRGRRWRDLFDLCEHIDLQRVNRKVLESLIHAGAFDGLPGHRRQLILNLERALAHGQRAAREREQGQVNLFGGRAEAAVKPQLESAAPYDPLEQLSRERQALGFFLSGHPFQEYREFVDCLPVATTRDAATLGEEAWVDLVGVVTSFHEARDRHKRLYARAHFEDRSAMIELIIHARLYEQTAQLVQGDSILVVGGRVRVRADGQREIVAERIVHVDEALAAWTQEILLKLNMDSPEGDRATVTALGGLLAGHGREDVQDAAAVGAPGAPLLVETQRLGRQWLLRSRRNRMVLTLANLRALRDLPGSCGVRLRVCLPPPIAARKWNRQPLRREATP
jgi:DNA polymerase-3 subunit alpha